MSERDPREREAVTEGLALCERLVASRALGVPGASDAQARDESCLAGASPEARLVALALAGVSPPSAEGTAPGRAPHGELHRVALEERVGSSEELLPSGDAERLWSALRSRARVRPLDATFAALAMGLRHLFPLSMSSPADVLRLSSGRAQEVFVAGLGFSAVRGHRTAEWALRRLLLEDEAGVDLFPPAFAGLGSGLVTEGVRLLARRIARAVEDREEWRDVGVRMLWTALSRYPDPGRELLLVLLSVAPDDEWARTILDIADQANGTAGSSGSNGTPGTRLAGELLPSWTRLPPAARAAVLERATPDPERWLRDHSPEVLQVGLASLDTREVAALRPRLASLLSHPDRQVKRLVTARLSERRGLKAVPSPSAARPRGEVVALPAEKLGHNPLARLLAAMSGDEPEAVASLALSLPEEDRPVARTALVRALDVPDVALRRASVEALGTIGLREDAPALLDAARRYRGLEGLVVAALRSLGAIELVDEVAILFHRRLKWADDEAVDDLVALAGERAAPHLAVALETRFYPPARAGAARGLGRAGFREAVFGLRTRALTDPNAEVRQAAAAALRQLTGSGPTAGDTAGYALMFAPVDDLDQTIEKAKQAGTAALPGVRATLARGSWRRRTAACEVLAGISGEESRRSLFEALVDADEDVRMAARVALSVSGFEPETPHDVTLVAMAERRFGRLLAEPEVADVPALEEGLHLGGHVFRTEVLGVLEALGKAGRWEPHAEVAAAVAAAHLDPEAVLREEGGLGTLLVTIDRTWQLHPHRSVLNRVLLGVPPAALEEAIGASTFGWRAREAVAFALGRPGDDEAARVLGRWVLDEDEDVRTTAIEALVHVGTAEAADALARGAESPFQEDADTIAAGLGALGTAALRTLRRLMASPWWEARRVAALALQEWRGDLQDAADLALPLALDAEYRVAEVARTALRKHGLAPGPEAVRGALDLAQTLTVAGAERWLGVDAHGRLADPGSRAHLAKVLAGIPDDLKAFRLGLAASLRVRELAPLLEAAARGEGTAHIGVRIAASEALRALHDPACGLCRGRGSVRCAGCEGEGEQVCQECEGKGVLRERCPEPGCNALETTRAIDSTACKTCRGRGHVSRPCRCAGGRVPCELCHGGGLAPCLLCEGTGESPGWPP